MEILNIFWAVVIFSLVVIIHEFGHFIFARLGGITVNEFSLGMGPRLFSFDAAGTKWSIKLFPIGGSCMMEGEDDASDAEGAFGNKPVWIRLLAVFGGPFFNFILAFLLSIFVIGTIGFDSSKVINVIKGFPADKAGIEVGDVITEINGKNINIGREVSTYFALNPLSNEEIKVKVKRGEKVLDFAVKPEEKQRYFLGFGYSDGDSEAKINSFTEDSPLKLLEVKVGDVITAINGTQITSGKELNNYFVNHPLDGKPVRVTIRRIKQKYDFSVMPKSNGSCYTIGLTPNLSRQKTGFLGTLYYAFNETKYVVSTTVDSLKLMITGRVNPKDMAGPVGIVNMIGSSYEHNKSQGLLIILLGMANISILISANLGVINLLPIPALDGGRLLFLIIEAIRRKPIDPEKEGKIHYVGFVLLMVLMVFLLFNDIKRIIGF